MSSEDAADLQSDALHYHRSPRPGKLEIAATKPMGNQRDLASLCVQICYDLTAGAIGFTRVRRAGMAVSIRLFG